MVKRILLFSITCISVLFAVAQDTSAHFKVMALPSVFHTPETSWGFGATTLFYFHPKDSQTNESNGQFFIDYTLMRQASFQSDINVFSKKNKYFFRASHDLSKFPEFYFGIGNENDPQSHCLINIAYFDFKLAAYRSVGNNLKLGPIINHQTLGYLSKSIMQEGINIDENGYSVSGIGMGLLIDKRNNILNPSIGHYAEAKLMQYFDHSHMSGGFINQVTDLRYYNTFGKTIFNSNLYSVYNQGVVPFRMMPHLGGPRFLRGYYAGRFRDNNLALAQIEFRRTAFWKIGVAAFTGVGQVYSDIAELNIKKFHYNYGAGLRFLINEHSQANIRLDYGRTRDSHGVYIVFGECF
jgi:outer membrane protein assembly factor BamA